MFQARDDAKAWLDLELQPICHYSCDENVKAALNVTGSPSTEPSSSSCLYLRALVQDVYRIKLVKSATQCMTHNLKLNTSHLNLIAMVLVVLKKMNETFVVSGQVKLIVVKLML